MNARDVADAIAEIIVEDSTYSMKVRIQRVKEVFYQRLAQEKAGLTYPEFVNMIIEADDKKRRKGHESN